MPPVRDVDDYSPLLTTSYHHDIIVGWGDCDPAQIAYTARIPAWGLEAVEGWYKACIGINWFDLNLDHGLGTPFVSLNFQFKSPIRGSGKLDIQVFVAKLGNSSIRHVVEGYQDGSFCFTGDTTAAFVDASKMKPISVPANIRDRIENYQSIQNREFAS